MESGFKNQESLLSQVVWLSDGPSTAPRVVRRNGKWFEFIIGIGNDEVAYITMTDSALRELCYRNGLNYKYLIGERV